MAKDKRISEIPGISQSAVVGLNRVGVVTVHDLLAAEFDRVAYIVDDYNEASRLVKEAKKLTQSEHGRKSRSAEPLVPGPLTQTISSSGARSPMRVASQTPAAQAPAPVRNSGGHHASTSPTAHVPTGGGPLASAMAFAAAGMTLSGEGAAEHKALLCRRLGIATVLLDHGCSEKELLTALVLEAAEAGAISHEDAVSRFGDDIAALLEECTALRAVPMLPTGKPPRYYFDMAAAASREARRVCAAHLMAACRDGESGLPGGAWYARLLMDALEAGGPDELVAMARQGVVSLKRAAA
jgi:hypothetical protein